MSRRRNEGPPVTLFSFQDIITSVMGIVILVMLVIALELTARELQSAAAQQSQVRSSVREALAAAQERLKEVKQALEVGAWNDLAGLTHDSIQRETSELERFIPILEQKAKQSQNKLEQLQRRREQAEQALAARASDEEALKRTQQEQASLEAELTNLASSTTMFFRLAETGGKQVWLVEVAKGLIQAARLGPTEPPQRFAGSTSESRRKQFLAWAASRNSSGEYFILLIKPSGARLYHEIERELRQKGFQVGLELISAEQTPIDPERGAPIIRPKG
jgi:hypothetical protein